VVDAFVHVIEQYLTSTYNAPIQDRFSESILITLIEEGEKVIKDPKDYDVRANIMWSATMALNSLISRGVDLDWSTHMIGHELTNFYGLDHAQTLAIILPNIMRYKADIKGDKILQFGSRVFGIDDYLSKDEIIEQTIQKTAKFFEDVGCPTKLSDYGFADEHFDSIVANFKDNGMTVLGENQDITPDDVRKVLEMCL
jgi:NADP-dependent alcohol dehydrogenase